MEFLAQEFTVRSKGWNRCVMLRGTFTRRILASAIIQCDKERFPNLFTLLNIAHYQLLHVNAKDICLLCVAYVLG